MQPCPYPHHAADLTCLAVQRADELVRRLDASEEEVMVLGQSLREAEAGDRDAPSPAQLEHVSCAYRLFMTADCRLGHPLLRFANLFLVTLEISTSESWRRDFTLPIGHK